jgi:hypothetical protein
MGMRISEFVLGHGLKPIAKFQQEEIKYHENLSPSPTARTHHHGTHIPNDIFTFYLLR